MARHKKHEEHEEHPSEAWLVAFADMMTLLMVTFLMMFAISALDLQKFKTFQEAFRAGTGNNTHELAATGAPASGTPEDVPVGATNGTPNPSPSAIPLNTGAPEVSGAALDDLKAKLEAAVAAAGLQDDVEVARDPRGLVLYITSGILFAPGDATLTGPGNALLTGLGPALSGIANDLVVEGHTDSRPISNSVFPSNWELSTARATAVLRYLEAHDSVTAARLSAAGYADTRPRNPGTDAAALAQNRRVDVVVEAPAEVAAANKAASAPVATPASTPVATPKTSEKATEKAASKH